MFKQIKISNFVGELSGQLNGVFYIKWPRFQFLRFNQYLELSLRTVGALPDFQIDI